MRAWSGLLVAVLALWVGVEVASLLVIAARPDSHFGVDVAADGRVVRVYPESATERAGIVRGDRILLAQMPERDRALVTGVTAYKPPGTRVTLPFERNGIVRVAAIRSQAYAQVPNWSAVLAAFVTSCLLVGVALALVVLRPSVVTWSFYLFACGYAIIQFGSLRFLLSGIAATLDLSAGGFALAMTIVGGSLFTSRFPSGTTTRTGRAFELIVGPIAAVAVALFLAAELTLAASPQDGRPLVYAYDLVLVVILALNVVVLVERYSKSRGDERARGQWVIAGSTVGLGALLVDFVIRLLRPAGFQGSLLDWILNTAIVCIPLSLAYAVLRHRVIDVRFAINRALVFGILTTALVLVFSFVEWLLAKELEATRIALYVELVLALVLGLSFDRLKRFVDGIVERAFFRRERVAAERLRLATEALPHSGATSTVEELLTCEPAEAYELASAAVFRRNGDGAFERGMAVGWGSAAGEAVSAADPLVAYLAARREPVELDSTPHRVEYPGGIAQPVLGVPVSARGELVAFVLYGPHASGETMDPQERSALGGLAVAAAAAYDHLEALALRRDVGELRRELAVLRATRDDAPAGT